MIWKSVNKNWTEVTTREINKSKAKELYNELIQKDIDTLKKSKGNKPKNIIL